MFELQAAVTQNDAIWQNAVDTLAFWGFQVISENDEQIAEFGTNQNR